MTRREVLLAALSALALIALPACEGGTTNGGANGPVSHNERALVLSVDEGDQTAEVRILERPDDLTLTWGTFDAGEEGTAAFSGWDAEELPAVGDDVVISWVGAATAESSFPVEVYECEPTVQFYDALGDAHEVRLPASLMTFSGMELDEALADFAENPSLAIEARADGDDLVVTFTSRQLASYRTDTGDTLEDYVKSVRASDVVSSYEVADDHAEVVVTATPELLDSPIVLGKALMGVPCLCAVLQTLDGIEDWAVEVVLVDSDSGSEVTRVSLPEESATLTRETWADAA